tara:strand:- start:230 stop:409 length:180 start_codon:yes stop_codon:yes gene_type:complete
MSKRKISSILKGDARLENESYEEFKLRRKAEKILLKKYLKGTPTDIKDNVPKENLTSWK